MTWTLDPGPDTFLDEARYLVFRCRATGLASSGDYLFMAQDGSPDWRRYLNARMLRLDGSEQAFAIDLLDFLPPAGFTEFAVRI